jgi:hypothetical protein
VFSIDNIAGLYRPFKIKENKTAFSQSKIQLENITDFLQDSAVNLIVGDFNLNYEKKEKTTTSTEKFMIIGSRLSQLLI